MISTISLALTVHETRTQEKALRDRVHDVEVFRLFLSLLLADSMFPQLVQILRKDGAVETVEGSRLVPGDIIIIPPHGCTMVCDAALIAGNCIVNESSLTGEETTRNLCDHHKPHLFYHDPLLSSGSWLET